MFFVTFLPEQLYLCIQDHITIHAVDLGNSAPLLSNAQLVDNAGEMNVLTVSIVHIFPLRRSRPTTVCQVSHVLWRQHLSIAFYSLFVQLPNVVLCAAPRFAYNIPRPVRVIGESAFV